MSFEQYISLFF